MEKCIVRFSREKWSLEVPLETLELTFDRGGEGSALNPKKLSAKDFRNADSDEHIRRAFNGDYVGRKIPDGEFQLRMTEFGPQLNAGTFHHDGGLSLDGLPLRYAAGQTMPWYPLGGPSLHALGIRDMLFQLEIIPQD